MRLTTAITFLFTAANLLPMAAGKLGTEPGQDAAAAKVDQAHRETQDLDNILAFAHQYARFGYYTTDDVTMEVTNGFIKSVQDTGLSGSCTASMCFGAVTATVATKLGPFASKDVALEANIGGDVDDDWFFVCPEALQVPSLSDESCGCVSGTGTCMFEGTRISGSILQVSVNMTQTCTGTQVTGSVRTLCSE